MSWLWLLWAAAVALAPIALTLGVIGLAKSHPTTRTKTEESEEEVDPEPVPEEVDLPPLEWETDEPELDTDAIVFISDETPFWLQQLEVEAVDASFASLW